MEITKKILSVRFGLETQAEMVEISHSHKILRIGVPKEIEKGEYCVPLTPQAVQQLCLQGNQVFLEAGAGKSANYDDIEYIEAGAKISSKKECFEAEIILKIAPPFCEEISLFNEKQILISNLHINSQTELSIKKLIQKKITAIGFEYIKDERNFFPVMFSLNEIAGYTAIMVAAEYLSNVHNGKGVVLGGITGISPCEVVILGADTAGEFAARAAFGLGATVKIFDNSIFKLKNIQNRLGQSVFTSILQYSVLSKALKSADVVIGAFETSENIADFRISVEMIKTMKRNSLIIDLNSSGNSCFETSELTNLISPTFQKYGVIHYCVPNITSRVARTASIALSNVLVPLLISLGKAGNITSLLKENLSIRNGTYLFNGILTNSTLAQKFNLPSRNIDFLMAAF